ncbi:MAG TPA: bifunctional DNA-formamidopyrimidine glycosylase/DNA-(apurinic or apyrimidinic site) lyase [Acidimicrobiales bacterium]|nr:bifunctional DNA-formamidopyrimidine glycosylase/DNA-(apurinic or apyrimidinic site) lyase [Acidimicrobiales bacterium]
MPELPEVETIRRQIAPALASKRIVDAWHAPNPKFVSASVVVGRTVQSVSRRGKYLLFALDDDRELIVHLGMTGVVRLRAHATIDPYVRASWTFADGTILELRDVRQFGRVAAVAAGDYRTLPTLHALGPDPFDPSFTSREFYTALRKSRQRVKTQLLSQRPIAGVGNIYADEALWRARVHAATRRVSEPRARELLAALRAVLAQGIDNGGTTLRDYRSFTGETGSNQHSLDCYGRHGQPCSRCGAVLVRRVYDGRGTTFCSICQRV